MNGSGTISKIRRFSTWLVLLIVAAVSVWFWISRKKEEPASIPTFEVTLGDFVDYVELRGVISVHSSTVITAPYNIGDLQILKLARNGDRITKGDRVVEFDPTSLQRSADQYRASLKQVEAEIARADAQQLLREEQTRTDQISAQFGLERAQLDASTGDVVPAIENEKNILALARAEQKLSELNTKIASSRISAEADRAGIIRRRDKAKADLEQAELNLTALALKSPGDGIITLLPNSQARTSILSGGSPLFKEGDRAYAGAAIAEIPDMSTIQATAAILEADRGRVQQGQPVILRVEALPDREHKGSVSEISPIAKTDYSTYPIRKSFDLKVKLEQPDPRLRAGMTTVLRVEVESLHNSIVIPAEAVFEKGGRQVAYVLVKNNYQERPLTLARRSGNHVLVSAGLKQKERVALQDPTIQENKE
jgi:HlyD family secretion protein